MMTPDAEASSRTFAPYDLARAAVDYAAALAAYCDEPSAVDLERASRKLEDAAVDFVHNAELAGGSPAKNL